MHARRRQALEAAVAAASDETRVTMTGLGRALASEADPRHCIKRVDRLVGNVHLQGVYRWLILSFMAFLLAHWCHEALIGTPMPDSGVAAQRAMETLLPTLLLTQLLLSIERFDSLAQVHGICITVNRCKI